MLCSHFAIPKDLTIHCTFFTLYSLVLIFSVIALISISKVNNPRLYIHTFAIQYSVYSIYRFVITRKYLFQNLLCLVYPWIICTVLTTILDVTVDVWLLRKVEIYSIWNQKSLRKTTGTVFYWMRIHVLHWIVGFIATGKYIYWLCTGCKMQSISLHSFVVMYYFLDILSLLCLTNI